MRWLSVIRSLLVRRLAAWIVDSGATCRMCSSRQLFAEYRCLQKSEKVKLGDERCLKAVGCVTVVLLMNLPGGETRKCRLQDMLYVPISLITEWSVCLKLGRLQSLMRQVVSFEL